MWDLIFRRTKTTFSFPRNTQTQYFIYGQVLCDSSDVKRITRRGVWISKNMSKQRNCGVFVFWTLVISLLVVGVFWGVASFDWSVSFPRSAPRKKIIHNIKTPLCGTQRVFKLKFHCWRPYGVMFEWHIECVWVSVFAGRLPFLFRGPCWRVEDCWTWAYIYLVIPGCFFFGLPLTQNTHTHNTQYCWNSAQRGCGRQCRTRVVSGVWMRFIFQQFLAVLFDILWAQLVRANTQLNGGDNPNIVDTGMLLNINITTTIYFTDENSFTNEFVWQKVFRCGLSMDKQICDRIIQIHYKYIN